MKTFQLKFKTLLVLFMVSLVFASCRDNKESEATKLEANPEQVNKQPKLKADPKTAKSIQNKDDAVSSPNSEDGNNTAITLDCNYFKENTNTILKDNPKASIDYIITCVTRIDGKLTIEPGVVIAFKQDAGMEFKDGSSFKMKGTAEKPIILTGKEQTKGFWRGIHSESSNANNKMSYVTIDFAGGKPPSGGAKAALGIYRENSILTLDHCTFSNSKNYGMVVNNKVEKDAYNIVMKNCIFTKNNIPFKTNVTRLRLFNNANSFSGNEKDYIELNGGTLYGNATWAGLDVPYFLQGNFKNEEGVLTMEPGTEIIMPARSWFHISGKASLVMVGTEENPIIIRGEHDVPGFWEQLTIDSSSPLNEIAHVNFKNAGRTTGKPNGAVKLQRSKFLNIHDVVFTDCFEYGISLNYGSDPFYLKHSNLTLNNTPKLFSDWGGKELTDPDNP
ncbi:hypothetical protein BZARG_2559 [Bizionia argentinensis JUB59]|uniref:Right-handed parallel beta-helix repeat-containing protein n=1 Tax=Bizionia argentinensis JUB59 TaxID=1046627 RepID=G2EGU2_9FLAO|nr:hypothetical protein [Bizionia argentinensis]EGV42352.1 hypothetical protein BZARG_2559 [Bizionia argentinensis JUB59]